MVPARGPTNAARNYAVKSPSADAPLVEQASADSGYLAPNGAHGFFSEQLGVPIAAIIKKGVEFLQSETADVIVTLQSSYDAVGAVRHFSEFRVVDSRILLFIDAAAPDERLYDRAQDDLILPQQRRDVQIPRRRHSG